MFGNSMNNLDILTNFGLTIREAKDWLKREPSFAPSDGSYHDASNRRKVTRTFSSFV